VKWRVVLLNYQYHVFKPLKAPGLDSDSHHQLDLPNPLFCGLLSIFDSMRAYYYDNLPGDQRLPHDYIPSRPVSEKTLNGLNVRFWTVPLEGYESKVDAIAKERGYKNRDMINVSKEGFGEVRLLIRRLQ
jgi:hypothetical protein